MAEALSTAHVTLNEYIVRGEDLVNRCQCRTDVHGTQKLARKIQAEVKFLKTVNIRSKAGAKIQAEV